MQNPVRGLLHGTAALISIAGAGVLWTRGAGDVSRQLALLVFGVSLVTLYTVSSLYHSVPWSEAWKTRMQRLDHAMIYVLVAGTYTPIAFIVLGGGQRMLALGIVWGIALVGILQKVWFPNLPHGYSVALQTAQGWIGLPFVVRLAQHLPLSALALTVLGGVFYTVGMVAFVTNRPRLWPRVFSYHEVFHVLVVAGSGVHYAMIFRYVAPFIGA